MTGGTVEHVILTRFNVRMATYAHPGDGWLEQRLDLFERYCLPSVAAQEDKDFRWLLFFDGETPPELLARVEALGADGLFEVVLVDGLFTAETVAQHLAGSTTPYLVTTRLDNDDAIARDFTATVHAQFDEQDLEFVNLVSGAQLYRGRIYQRPYTKNPFVSLVERRTDGPPRTVFCARHFAVDTVGPVRNVRTAHPAWLQVIHGDNVLNEVVGVRTRGARVAPWFGCRVDTDDRAVDYWADRTRGAARVVVRLASQPHRVVELARVVLARRSDAVSGRAPSP